MLIPRPVLLATIAITPALAHVSDGIDYSQYRDRNGAPCCNDTDCRSAQDFVDATGRDVKLLIDGQWIEVPRAPTWSTRARATTARTGAAGAISRTRPAAGSRYHIA